MKTRANLGDLGADGRIILSKIGAKTVHIFSIYV
jgi:hypothetical protein